MSETIQSIKDALAWLKSRRQDVHYQREGFKASLYCGWTPIDEHARHRLHELQDRVERFDKVIAQQETKLREHRKALERQRQSKAIESAEPLIQALPRPDVLTVKVVERLPTYIDHLLADQIDRRGVVLESWNYHCLNTRNRRPTRRYEGFHGRSRHRDVYELCS